MNQSRVDISYENNESKILNMSRAVSMSHFQEIFHISENESIPIDISK